MIVLNVIAVLLHLAFGGYLLRKYPNYTVLFGLVFFLQTWSLISCCYNDFGVYNFELFRETVTTLATSRLALFFGLFNLGFLAMMISLRDRPLKRVDYLLRSGGLEMGNFKLVLYLSIAAAIAYVVYSFATEGIPVLQGIHKLLFYREAGPLDRVLINYGFLFSFILGFLHRPGKWLGWSSVLLMSMLLYMVLTGNKFSALINLSAAYLAASSVPWLAKHPDFFVLRRRYMGLIGTLAVILVAGAYLSYVYWGRDAAAALELLRDRVFALQGHLWWATDHNLFVFDKFDPTHWLAELRVIAAPESMAEGSAGMKYVMVQAIGAENAFPVFDIGYLYTMAYPAILTLTFSYPVAMLIQLGAGGLFGLMLYYLHFSVLYRHLWRSIVAITMIIPFTSVLGTGNFWVFVTIGIALKLFMLIAAEVGLVRAGRGEQV